MSNEKVAVEKVAVGDNVSSLCLKCKSAQTHIVTAMQQTKITKVQCRTCGKQHRYRDPNAVAKTTRKRSTRLSPEKAWEKLMDDADSKKKIPYTFSGDFRINDIIDHATFGLGVVTHLLSDDKIQVTFKEGEKILVARR